MLKPPKHQRLSQNVAPDVDLWLVKIPNDVCDSSSSFVVVVRSNVAALSVWLFVSALGRSLI